MAEKRSIGLASLTIGAIAEDGDMGTTLAALGVTYQDSADLVQADDSLTEIYSEENDDPEEIIAIPGIKTLKFSIMNFDADTLVLVLGGTATGTIPNKKWLAPSSRVIIEKSIKLLTKTGNTIDIPRARVSGKLNMKFSKKGVALVDITARVMVPSKAGVAPISIY